jgi:7-carboxy-7-deazaguanine synthase
MSPKLDWNTLFELSKLYYNRLIFKVVIFTDEDLDFAQDVKEKFPAQPFYLSAGTPPPREGGELTIETKQIVQRSYQSLAEKVLKRPSLYGSIVLPQLHLLLWGRQKGV